MQNIEELGRIEQEFEDLQGLIKQHFGSLRELDEMQLQIRTLNRFQELTQATNQKATETCQRLEGAQQKLNERTEQLDLRVQELSNAFTEFKQNLNQQLGEMASWSQKHEAMKADIAALETQLSQYLKQEVEQLGKTDKTFENYFQDLENRFRKLYVSVKETRQKAQDLYNVLIFIGLLGLAALIFAVANFYANQ